MNMAPGLYCLSKDITDQILFNPTDLRWLAGKAVNVVTSAVGTGIAIWGANKLGMFGQNGLGSVYELGDCASSPFSDSTPVGHNPLVGKSKPPVRIFDKNA